MTFFRTLFLLALVAGPLWGCGGGHNEITRPPDFIKPPGTDAGGAMGAKSMLKSTAPQK